MARPPAALRGFAEQVLGPCHPVTRQVCGRDDAHVARFRDAGGREYVVKCHSAAEKHHREVHAYQHWTSALGASAPTLVAANPTTMMILVTALPGTPVGGQGGIADHRQAGSLLRAIHRAEPLRALDDFGQWLTSRVAWWQEQAAPLLSPDERQAVDRHLAALHALGTPAGGPCHLDYQPRNWLSGPAGTLAVIDFEHARIDLQARDFVRLYFRYWPSRPDLREAFFDGYGRPLTQQEHQTIRCCGAVDALTALARGTQTGDATLTAHGRATLHQLQGGDPHGC
jgi:Ser/Thr protein kinase RdoA (MazF antagonist)